MFSIDAIFGAFLRDDRCFHSITPPTSSSGYNGIEDVSIRENGSKAMAANRPRYSKEEFARRGDAIYEREIRPTIEADNKGKFVVIDIETGAYEVDADELAASDRLL